VGGKCPAVTGCRWWLARHGGLRRVVLARIGLGGGGGGGVVVVVMGPR